MKITIEPLEFPLCVKERITKIPKISKLHLEFVSGILFLGTMIVLYKKPKNSVYSLLFAVVLTLIYSLRLYI